MTESELKKLQEWADQHGYKIERTDWPDIQREIEVDFPPEK